mmetsp:Transcript_2610/g.5449  ORF Transcript_2610/g.5449 Transcript_2610/m.5449 type:complete len:446 (+) Transcript_2610:565-1902(+)
MDDRAGSGRPGSAGREDGRRHGHDVGVARFHAARRGPRREVGPGAHRAEPGRERRGHHPRDRPGLGEVRGGGRRGFRAPEGRQDLVRLPDPRRAPHRDGFCGRRIHHDGLGVPPRHQIVEAGHAPLRGRDDLRGGTGGHCGGAVRLPRPGGAARVPHAADHLLHLHLRVPRARPGRVPTGGCGGGGVSEGADSGGREHRDVWHRRHDHPAHGLVSAWIRHHLRRRQPAGHDHVRRDGVRFFGRAGHVHTDPRQVPLRHHLHQGLHRPLGPRGRPHDPRPLEARRRRHLDEHPRARGRRPGGRGRVPRQRQPGRRARQRRLSVAERLPRAGDARARRGRGHVARRGGAPQGGPGTLRRRRSHRGAELLRLRRRHPDSLFRHPPCRRPARRGEPHAAGRLRGVRDLHAPRLLRGGGRGVAGGWRGQGDCQHSRRRGVRPRVAPGGAS